MNQTRKIRAALKVLVMLAVVCAAPVRAQAVDPEDAFIGQDEIVRDRNPLEFIYLGASAGAAKMTQSTSGFGTLSFDAGVRIADIWSAGLFASVLPEVKAPIHPGRVTVFGAEAHYHLDEYLPHAYVGVQLGFLTVENASNFGVGAKLAYDYPLSQYFWLTGQGDAFINTRPSQGGHAFSLLVGVKFQRAEKKKAI